MLPRTASATQVKHAKACALPEEHCDRCCNWSRSQHVVNFVKLCEIHSEERVTGNFHQSPDRSESHIAPKASCESRFASCANRFSVALIQSRVSFQSQVGLTLRLFVTSPLGAIVLVLFANLRTPCPSSLFWSDQPFGAQAFINRLCQVSHHARGVVPFALLSTTVLRTAAKTPQQLCSLCAVAHSLFFLRLGICVRKGSSFTSRINFQASLSFSFRSASGLSIKFATSR